MKRTKVYVYLVEMLLYTGLTASFSIKYASLINDLGFCCQTSYYWNVLQLLTRRNAHKLLGALQDAIDHEAKTRAIPWKLISSLTSLSSTLFCVPRWHLHTIIFVENP